MNLFYSRRHERIMNLRAQRAQQAADVPKKHIRSAVFSRCKTCGASGSKAELAKSDYVCPHCGYHHPIGAYLRLSILLDSGSFLELNEHMRAPNVLDFPDYEEKLRAIRRQTGLREAVVTAEGRIEGIPAVFAVFDSRFLMGSMGAAVGEKVTRAAEYAANRQLPLCIFSASGGARMQEGIISLMQMAKTSAAIAKFSKAGGLYISILTHPTTGGVMASFASLGDITLAEPGALIGFAGPRVIRQTIGQDLPEGFQRAEFLQEHGFIDQIIPRGEMKETLAQLFRLHGKGAVLHE